MTVLRGVVVTIVGPATEHARILFIVFVIIYIFVESSALR